MILVTLRPAWHTLLFALLALAGCDNPPSPAPPAPPKVSVEVVKPERLVLTTELNGRLVSPRTAEVRARVAGIILERVYHEGSDVKKGDVLFRIDPAPLEADVQSAEATVRKTQATAYQTRLRAARYEQLIESRAISRQDYENARAADLQAQADVAGAQAALKRSRLSLGYATVTAPIDGRIGKAQVTEGALVGQDSTTALAVIQQLNPIYADVTQSTRQLNDLRRAIAQGQLRQLAAGQVSATLLEDDGSPYSLPGKLLFSDVTVDQSTGQITLRGQFPNPRNELLPGSFARVQMTQAVLDPGISVPQRAVSRDAAGDALVMVVDPHGQVQERRVRLGRVQHERWVVEQGLAAGERVVVAGLQHIQAGMSVDVQPALAEGVGSLR